MKVRILFENNPDGDDVIGVFASEEAAQQYQADHDMHDPLYFTIEYEVRE